VTALVCAVYLLPSHVSCRRRGEPGGLRRASLDVSRRRSTGNDRTHTSGAASIRSGIVPRPWPISGTRPIPGERVSLRQFDCAEPAGLMFNAGCEDPRCRASSCSSGDGVRLLHLSAAADSVRSRRNCGAFRPRGWRSRTNGSPAVRVGRCRTATGADRLLEARRSGDSGQIDGGRTEYARAQAGFESARRDGAGAGRAERRGHEGQRHEFHSSDVCSRATWPDGRRRPGHAMIWRHAVVHLFGDERARNGEPRRYLQAPRAEEGPGAPLSAATRMATVVWGAYAVLSAHYVKRMGSLIEAVNLLGRSSTGDARVFVLAFRVPEGARARRVLGRACRRSGDLRLLVLHGHCVPLVQRPRVSGCRGRTGLVITCVRPAQGHRRTGTGRTDCRGVGDGQSECGAAPPSEFGAWPTRQHDRQ